MKNYYLILGLSNFSTSVEIKAVFRRLAKLHHPDKNGGNTEKFLEIFEAYEFLMDETRKISFDENLKKELSDRINLTKEAYFKPFFTEFESKKNSFKKLSKEERDFFIRSLSGKIPDFLMTSILFFIGVFLGIMPIFSVEGGFGVIFGFVFGLPLIIIGIRDYTLIFKVSELEKSNQLFTKMKPNSNKELIIKGKGI